MSCASQFVLLPASQSGVEGGCPSPKMAVLAFPIELEVECCPACGCVRTKFVIEFVWANGFFGTHVCCGEERVAPFTRTMAM
jgi:hypothetical protein